MCSERIVWIVDHHKFRREGAVAALSPWAKTLSLSLRSVEQPHHIMPSELITSADEISQVCVFGVGGQSMSAPSIRDTIAELKAVLRDRPLLVFMDHPTKADIDWAQSNKIASVVSTSVDTEIAVQMIAHVFDGGTFYSTCAQEVSSKRKPNVQQVAEAWSASSTGSNAEGRASDALQAVKNAILDKPRANALPELSDRQIEVLNALRLGHSNKVIARDLNLSEATVKVHVRALIQKFDVMNRTQVALLAENHMLAKNSNAPSNQWPSQTSDGAESGEANETTKLLRIHKR